MNREIHERARQLLTAHRVEGIQAAERDWLERHLASCTECASAAETLNDAIRSLRAFPVFADPELVRQTRLAVRSRAEQLQSARTQSTALWIATAVSSVLMILTTSFVWQTFAWLGRITQIPSPVWEVAFLMWWFLPATVLAAAAAWRHNANDWGQR
jgi:anti-sigma factor RsiW